MFSKKEFSVNPTDVFGFHWDVEQKLAINWKEGRKKPVLRTK